VYRFFTVAVDITNMISDRVILRLVLDTLLCTSTIIQFYSLVRAFLYPPPGDARGCRRGPAHCPGAGRTKTMSPSYYEDIVPLRFVQISEERDTRAIIMYIQLVIFKTQYN